MYEKFYPAAKPREFFSYTFDDVLIVPQLSHIRSRSAADISTVVGGVKLSLPIISSPMDTVTESSMAIAMGQEGGMGIIHRFMSPEHQMEEVRKVISARNLSGSNFPIAYAIGVGEAEFGRAKLIQKEFGNDIDFVAIDIANGHSVLMKEMIERTKLLLDKTKIIAGNVATGEGWLYLAKAGADAVRIGIGGGCFVPGTKVLTKDGLKPIEQIVIGDVVLTHTGSWKKVINTMEFDREEQIVSINGIECTKNHEFYVINKADARLVNEENIHEYAFWIEAEHLVEGEHLLIKPN
jgi:IMP dehydrogenase/GMP reductase